VIQNRAAQGDQHAALRRCECGAGANTRSRERGGLRGVCRRDERKLGVADTDQVARVQRTRVDALAVDEGPVARQPVVGQHPVRAHKLQDGVQPRDLPVPRERDVVALVAADRQPARSFGQLDDHLPTVGVAIQDERVPAPLGGEPVV
jgi:hypothetical protein